MQLPELRKIAKEKGIKNVTKLKKNELIELLKDTEKETNVVEQENSSKEEVKENKEEFVSGNRSI